MTFVAAPQHDRTATVRAMSLRTYLAIGLLFRVPAVLFARGYEFVDHQYQYVDPAWHIATGQAFHRTWEWVDGIRSEVYPELLAALFKVLLAAGIEEPLPLMTATRAVHALLSLLPLALFWLLVVRWQPQRNAVPILLCFAANGLGIYAGVQASGLTFGATLAVSAVLAFHGPRLYPLLAGLCLGFAFCGRFQDALFGPALFAAGLLQRRTRASMLLLLGCLPGILVQGFDDLEARGVFLGSAWEYVDVNVLQGVAATFGTRPWWFYLGCLAVLTAFVPPFLRVASNALRRGVATLPVAFAAAAVHLLLHSLIARKSPRFVLPSLWLWFTVVTVGLHAAPLQTRLQRWYRGALLAIQFVLLLWSWCWFGHEGPVRAADWLRRQPAFTNELIVVGGDATTIGGFFHLQRAAVDVHATEPGGVADLLAALPPRPVRWVMTVRDPLRPADRRALEQQGALRDIGLFTGFFDRRKRARRHLYRLDAATGTDAPR